MSFATKREFGKPKRSRHSQGSLSQEGHWNGCSGKAAKDEEPEPGDLPISAIAVSVPQGALAPAKDGEEI